MRPSLGRVLLVAGCAALVLLALAAGFHRSTRRATTAISATLPSTERRAQRYAGAASCRPCHPSAYDSWHRSYHRTMTQPVSATAVLGRFDGHPLDAHGQRALQVDDGYAVEMLDVDGALQRRPVVMTTGSHHMQVYWVAEPDGTLQSFPYAFLLPEATWVPNEATLLRPWNDGVVYTWNRVCIQCHAVAGVPGFDPDTQRVRSQVVDLGIACEACHGPGLAHVAARHDPWTRYAGRSHGAAEDIVRPAAASGHAASEICGQCHSITAYHDEDAWLRHGHDGVPPQPVATWATVVRHPVHADQPKLDALLEADSEYLVSRFWSDGMVRVSGREYQGLVASPCYASPEFGCLSCHSMHQPRAMDDQLRFDAAADAMCTACHDDPGRFGTAHTRHAAASDGSRCVNCHMPHTTYGLLKAIRSHHIDTPSVVTTLETGRPNACNACHLDRSLAWAAGWIERWYGSPRPEVALSDEPAMARAALAGDAGQRALAAWHLGWAPARRASALASDEHGWDVPLLAELLVDPYPAVRWVAFRSLRTILGTDFASPDALNHDPEGLRARTLDRWGVGSARDGFIGAETRARWSAERDETPVTLAE